nr:ATP-binding protein [Muribaculaceae bacterium]
SFKDSVEFNTFPSSKTHSHEWHKITCGHATVLRMSAIYGANGAGKSNLLKCISLLKAIVGADKLSDLSITNDLFFRFDEKGKSNPSELAVEFYVNGQIFYYHIAFTRKEIVSEELILSRKTKDITIFSRTNNSVDIAAEFLNSMGKTASLEVFIDGINRLLRPDMSALSFLGNYYSKELPIVNEAYYWIMSLQVVLPSMSVHELPHLMDINSEFAELVNTIVPELKTGITRLHVKKELLNEEDIHPNSILVSALSEAKREPGVPIIIPYTKAKEISNVVIEDEKAYKKTLVVIHTDSTGKEIEMEIEQESDGTRRLIEYMPLLYAVLKSDKVFIVDEIERSIHPIMIKTLISKISESKEANGQIIFTTHESCLLDQSIFRPDEIWFAQKDVDQSTQLYPLSDYNIHKTANIENGYLNGRYGGIPFLSNLTDLNW